MVEANTEGPKGWAPVVEKKNSQQALRDKVDTGVLGNFQRKVESPRIREEWAMENLLDADDARRRVVIETLPKAKKRMSRLMDGANALAKASRLPGVGKIAVGIGGKLQDRALDIVKDVIDQGAGSIVARDSASKKYVNAMYDHEASKIQGEKFGELQQYRELRREVRPKPNRHDRRRNERMNG